MKPKISPTSPKAKANNEVNIDKLYEESMKTIDRPKNAKVRLSISLLIIIIVIGFVSGVVAQFAILSYGPDIPVLQQLQIFNDHDVSILSLNRTKKVVLSAEEVESIARELSNSVVAVYVEKENADGLNASYFSVDRVADGLVITDDGFLVIPASLVDEELSYVVVTNDNTVYLVDRIVHDDRAGFTYLKVDAHGLETVGFASTETLYNSEEVLLLDTFVNISAPIVFKTALLAKNYRGEKQLFDVVRSSEEFSATVLLGDAIPSNFNNRIAFTLDSKALGIVTLVGDQYVIIPFERLEPAIDEVLADDSLIRSFLGITYVRLSSLTEAPSTAAEGYTAGALLFSTDLDAVSSIIENSPAEKAGLQDGDIITEIDGTILNENQDLADIIVGHDVGDTIVLTIIRDSEVQTITITLDPIK